MTLKEKKGGTNVVLIEPTFPWTKINTSSYSTQTGSRLAATQPTPNIPPSQQRANVGATTNPFEPPYPRSYDPNARCDYHGGAIGHAMERCWSLKHKVQNLLDNGLLGFEDKGPNVHNNHLPAHGSATVNTISHRDERVASPSRTRDGGPRQAVDSANQVEEGPHLYPSDNITVVPYIEGNNNPRPKPLIIQYNSAPKPVPFIIQVATKPVYNNNVVPWRYPTEEPQAPQIKEETTTPEITNIAGIGGMTWSGRIFAPEALRNKKLVPVKK
ncbi:hypothetical protein CR513_16663, partial [Mucuna pruriens]